MPNPEILPTPAQKPLREVFDQLIQRSELEGQPMYLLGHGTAHGEASDFFIAGLEMLHGEKGNYGDISEIAVGLDLEDYESTKEMLNNWPHREAPNVVLLAVSAPGDELSKLQQHFYFDGMVQRCGKTGLSWGEEVEVTHIPPDWILGVYDRKSGLVSMNPTFSGRRVLPADFEKSAGERYTRHLAQKEIVGKFGLVGLMPGGMEPDQKLSEPPQEIVMPRAEDLKDEDWLW